MTPTPLDAAHLPAAVQPERRLMAAVLDDAMRCFRLRGRADRRSRRLFLEAAAWLFEDDHSSPFSCVNVCQALGVDVGALRSSLCAPPRTVSAA